MGFKDALTSAAVTAAVVGSGVAADVQKSNLTIADPVERAAVAALSDGHAALEARAEGQRQSDEVAEATDVTWEQTSSLDDPPDGWSELSGIHSEAEQSESTQWAPESTDWAAETSSLSEPANAEFGSDASGGAR